MAEDIEGEAPLPKETNQGLPVVSADTITYVLETYSERWGAYLEEVKTRLINENPNLRAFIEAQLDQYPPELHNPIIEGIVGAIALLELQAMANKKG
jgi:hypothetical protein